MARTLEEIQEQMLLAKSNEVDLIDLTSTSKTAEWNLWIYIVSFCIMTLENIFDLHAVEVDEKLSLLKPHTLRWYREQALAFQYGFDLIEDSHLFDNTNNTEEEKEASKIIKYSAVTETEEESRLIIKIATESDDLLSPVTATQFENFKAYLAEFKDAGVKTTVINYLPDRLKLNIRIKRDALIIDTDGLNRLTGDNPVDNALNEFMKELPFNGELSIQKLEAKLLEIAGVEDLSIDLAETAWIDAELNDYGNWQIIDISQIPVSGYFSINLSVSDDTLSTISYV